MFVVIFLFILLLLFVFFVLLLDISWLDILVFFGDCLRFNGEVIVVFLIWYWSYVLGVLCDDSLGLDRELDVSLLDIMVFFLDDLRFSGEVFIILLNLVIEVFVWFWVCVLRGLRDVLYLDWKFVDIIGMTILFVEDFWFGCKLLIILFGLLIVVLVLFWLYFLRDFCDDWFRYELLIILLRLVIVVFFVWLRTCDLDLLKIVLLELVFILFFIGIRMVMFFMKILVNWCITFVIDELLFILGVVGSSDFLSGYLSKELFFL